MVWTTLTQPQTVEHWDRDAREHHFRYFAAAHGKCLHVVVEGRVVVTAFWDQHRGRAP